MDGEACLIGQECNVTTAWLSYCRNWLSIEKHGTVEAGRGTQVVRERSAKPLCVSSILTRASSVSVNRVHVGRLPISVSHSGFATRPANHWICPVFRRSGTNSRASSKGRTVPDSAPTTKRIVALRVPLRKEQIRGLTVALQRHSAIVIISAGSQLVFTNAVSCSDATKSDRFGSEAIAPDHSDRSGSSALKFPHLRAKARS